MHLPTFAEDNKNGLRHEEINNNVADNKKSQMPVPELRKTLSCSEIAKKLKPPLYKPKQAQLLLSQYIGWPSSEESESDVSFLHNQTARRNDIEVNIPEDLKAGRIGSIDVAFSHSQLW